MTNVFTLSPKSAGLAPQTLEETHPEEARRKPGRESGGCPGSGRSGPRAADLLETRLKVRNTGMRWEGKSQFFKKIKMGLTTFWNYFTEEKVFLTFLQLILMHCI